MKGNFLPCPPHLSCHPTGKSYNIYAQDANQIIAK